METVTNNPQYQLLVRSIQETFEGSDKVAEVLYSLHALFSQFDEQKHMVANKNGERKCEREMLLGVITILLDHLIKDQNNNIQVETISKFLQVLRKGVDQSTMVNKLMQEFHESTSIMVSVKRMLEADGVTDNDIEDVTHRIDSFLHSSYNANNSVSWFQDQTWDFEFDGHQRADIGQLSNGWEKNNHEFQKRTKKLELFREESSLKLETLEKSIDESKERNEDFRRTLNETSDRISNLIEELHDTTKKSEFLRREMEIVDSTVTDMEQYKQKTEKEYTELEEQLFEKQNSLIDFMKKIDRNLDDSLNRHQQIIERHDTFNEALEELAQCYSDFEYEEHQILQKHNIKPIQLPRDDENKTMNDSAVLQEQIILFEREREDIHRRSDILSSENTSLASDVEDLFNLNTKLTRDNEKLKERLSTAESDENTSLASDVEDLFNMNTKLTRDNKELKERLSTAESEECTSLASDVEQLKRENEELKERLSTAESEENTKEMNKLKEKIGELEKKNGNLRNINVKTQDIFMENKELVEETSQLQDDIEKLEEQIRQYETKEENLESSKSALTDENNALKLTLQEINEIRQARVLYTKTNMANILSLQDLTKKEEVAKEVSLEQILQNERDRNVTLEKSSKRHQANATILGRVCRELGLDRLQTGTVYNINIKSESGSHIFTNAGITLTKKELDTFNVRHGEDGVTRAEENVIDELSIMLQESYLTCNQMKTEHKRMQLQINNLQLELSHREESHHNKAGSSPSSPSTPNAIKPHQQHTLDNFIKLYNEMGIPQLQYGTTYSIHYQTISSKGSSRRTSQAFQHSVNAINFDKIKELMSSIGGVTNIAASPKPSRKVSRAPILEAPPTLDLNTLQLQKYSIMEEVRPVLKLASTDVGARELERLLRIAKRDNGELMKKNRDLRNEMNGIKENKERFFEVHRKQIKEDHEQEEDEEEVTETRGSQKGIDVEGVEDLQNAYDLSDANCSFLEKQNQTLSNRLQQVESIVDQHRNDIFDKDEQFECVKKENKEMGKKLDECKRQTVQLKQEIEYLESDVEYCKVKLQEVGVEHPIAEGKHIAPRMPKENQVALKADFETLLSEKSSLILECDSLAAKIKFLEAENKFALEEARLVQAAQTTNEEDPDAMLEMIVSREKSKSFIEKEVKSEGLAKRFKALQKENRTMKKEYEESVAEKMENDQKMGLLMIEVEALRSSNQEMEDRIVELERKGTSNVGNASAGMGVVDLVRRLSVIEEHQTSTNNGDINEQIQKECEVIKEEAIYISQENEEIKEANVLLLRRNSNLRRESLAAGTTKKQLALLIDKLSTMENENAVLKMESMKQRGRRASRRASQAWPEMEMFQQHVLNTSSQSTQTTDVHPTLRTPSQDSDTGSVDVEELEFMIEELTKRNSELKTKLYTQDKRLQDLESESKHLEDVNLKVMDRNTSLKEQLEREKQEKEEEKKLLSESDMSADDQGLGINLFFKNDILSAYEKAELEEEINSLKYENQLLKQDLSKKTDDQLVLQQKIRDMEGQYTTLPYQENSPVSLSLTLAVEESSCMEKKDEKEESVLEERIKVLEFRLKKLEEEKDNLTLKCREQCATIEQLERQVLYGERRGGDLQKTHETMNDDLFNERFLLQSEFPDKTATQEDVRNEDWSLASFAVEPQPSFPRSASDSDSDEEETFKGCIKEGELTSEMEDLFRRYTESSSSLSMINDQQNDENVDLEEEYVAHVFIEDPIQAEVIGKPGRFRSKEDLEKSVDRQEKEILQLRNELSIAEVNKARDKQQVGLLQKELEEANRKLLLSQQTFMESSISLNDRLDEVEHLQNRVLILEREEERMCNEIDHLENHIREKEQECKEFEGTVEEYKYKVESTKKECDGYKSVLEEHERLLQDTHENNSQMQRNFNELYKEMNEREDALKEMKQQNHDLNKDLQLMKEERNSSENKVKQLEQDVVVLEQKLGVAREESRSLEELVHEFEHKCRQMEEGLLSNQQNDERAEKHCTQLQENLLEQELLIESLRQQLRDSEDVITLYAEADAKKEVFAEENSVEQDFDVTNTNNISFEINQASLSTKTAIEMSATETSFENGNITLPEIQIRRYSRDVNNDLCPSCIQRSNSVPGTKSQTTPNSGLFPNKYFQPKNQGLSEVSDIEDSEQKDGVYSADYVRKLKLKLKSCGDKVRECNKLVRNQNEDIDNFLEDIANKEYTILQLRDELNEMRDKVKKSQEERLCDVKTPSFSSSFSQDDLVKELIDLAEECCQEIGHLHGLVKDLPSPGDLKELEEKLHASRDKIHRLRAKLSRCVELGLISPSMSRDERTTCDSFPNVLDVPGQTVNEIKTENELLKIYNDELKQELLEMQELHMIHGGGEPSLHSSMFQDNVSECPNEDPLSEITDRNINIKDLTDEITSLNGRLQTAESQIEKDWEIIENQSEQLENLHQQFIEQRDDNIKHQRIVKDKNYQIEKMVEEMVGIQHRSKGKEEELGRILMEKEDGIEKLHSMIRELEKSLGNSQVHIEGILKESIENREADEAKDRLIHEQEKLIAHLKQELDGLHLRSGQTLEEDSLQGSEQLFQLDQSLMRTRISEVSKSVDTMKKSQTTLQGEVKRLHAEYTKHLTGILSQLKHYVQVCAGTSVTKEHQEPNVSLAEENIVAMSTEFLSPASSDSEALFVPRQSSGDSFNASPIEGKSAAEGTGFWSTKFRKAEKEKEQLLEKHKEIIKRKDNMHKLQIDTIIRSLAKRHNKKARPALTPSPELLNASSRMGQTEFLKTCLSKVKYSSDG